MVKLAVCIALLVLLTGALSHVVTLDFLQLGLVYDGHGALSAGASSRLLYDYPEPYRSDILDYLFLPGYGASLHLLKVEIGGDVQSTDGTEASHSHTSADYSCVRGYEWWLMTEAKQRNPNILLYALSWGMPGWVGNGTYFSEDCLNYHVSWLFCAQSYNLSIQYIGIWNERSWGNLTFLMQFRAALDRDGFEKTIIVFPDGWTSPQFIATLNASLGTFLKTAPIIGVHYPCLSPSPVTSLGFRYWASEDFSTVADWTGSACWGRTLNQNYVRGNMTSTIAWSLIWSAYDGMPYYGNGLIGSYEVNAAIWTSAHTCQFSQPGWRYLKQGGGSGLLPRGGSYVTMTDGKDFSLIVETLQGACLRCPAQNTSAQNITFNIRSWSKKVSKLHVWHTNSTVQFESLKSVDVTDGVFSILIEADAIYTLTTTTGQKKARLYRFGVPSTPIPQNSDFPYPYNDDFESYPKQSYARYFSDQGGSFNIETDPYNVTNQVVMQMAPISPGNNTWIGDPDPITYIGGNFTDFTVTVNALMMLEIATPSAYVALCGRVLPQAYQIIKGGPSGYCLRVYASGTWSLSAYNVTLQQGHVKHFSLNKYHSLQLYFEGETIMALLDDTLLTATSDSTFTQGQVAMGSGWHYACFDDFFIQGQGEGLKFISK